MKYTHDYYMKEALLEAYKAKEIAEVPIGCVIVCDNEIIARGHNRRNTEKNPLYHAEIQAIDLAAKAVGDWRLEACSLYVTIEPCPMCAGAILQARIKGLIYGASNPKAGCCGSVFNLVEHHGFNHQVAVLRGVLEEECASVMQDFFRELRESSTGKEY